VEGILYSTFSVAKMGYASLHGNVDYQGHSSESVDSTESSSLKPVVGIRINLWGNASSGDEVGVQGLIKVNISLLCVDMGWSLLPSACLPVLIARCHRSYTHQMTLSNTCTLPSQELQKLPKTPSDPAGYSVVIVTPSHDFSDILAAAQTLQADPSFLVTLPEQLLALLQTRTGGARQCPMAAGAWGNLVGELPKCSCPAAAVTV